MHFINTNPFSTFKLYIPKPKYNIPLIYNVSEITSFGVRFYFTVKFCDFILLNFRTVRAVGSGVFLVLKRLYSLQAESWLEKPFSHFRRRFRPVSDIL